MSNLLKSKEPKCLKSIDCDIFCLLLSEI